MREIKFRGQRYDNKRFFYGFYSKYTGPNYDWTGKWSEKETTVHFIKDESDMLYAVVPKTVGEYSGMKDIDEVEVFENDILEVRDNSSEKGVWKVKFDSGCFLAEKVSSELEVEDLADVIFDCDGVKQAKVVGNIHGIK
jgi:uncharacterized phage protein (TIGR01671 family)